MEEIKSALSQALHLQALQPEAQLASALMPTGAPAPAEPGLKRSSSASDATKPQALSRAGPPEEIRSALGC